MHVWCPCRPPGGGAETARSPQPRHAADLKNFLDDARDEAGRYNVQLTDEIDRANQNAKARRKVEQDNNDLARKLAAAQAREEALREQVEDLRRVLESAQQPQETQEEADRRARLEMRRSRAAEACMENAWEAPEGEGAGHCATVAQAVLALPLEAFDATIELAQDANNDRFWRVNGTILTGYLPPAREEDYLARRYGITHQEMRYLNWALNKEIRKHSKDAQDPRGSMVMLPRTCPPQKNPAPIPTRKEHPHEQGHRKRHHHQREDHHHLHRRHRRNPIPRSARDR